MFNEEAAGRTLPTAIYTIGLGMVIPTLIEFGTDEQKERYVAKALRGEEVWSQLFSEPGAGSDVASLQMRAELDGEEWVLNGQKVWTTGAQLSDFGAVIARTNVEVPEAPGHHDVHHRLPGPRRGDPAAAPDDRRLRASTRCSSTTCAIPAANVIGPVDGGWRCAIAMLMNERVAIGSGGGGGARAAPAAASGRTSAWRGRTASTRTRSCARASPTSTSASGCWASSASGPARR